MPDKNAYASLLLLLFLFLLNLTQLEFGAKVKEKNKYKNVFFVEIIKGDKRAEVLKFYSKPPLGLLKKCDYIRNGLSIKILANNIIICKDMSAYKKITLGIPISINSERIYGLCAVPGIGPSIAKEIIKERKRKGKFKSLDELLNVHGIGKELYRKMLPYISL